VVGSLAEKKPEHGTSLSGVLVKRNFSYHIMSPKDVPSMSFNYIIRYLLE